MKLTCKSRDIVGLLSNVIPAKSSASARPYMTHVVLRADIINNVGSLSASMYGDDSYSSFKMDCDVQERGFFIIHSDDVAMLRSFGDSELTIESKNEKALKISDGKTSYKIDQKISMEDFPNTFIVSSVMNATFSVEKLKKAIQAVSGLTYRDTPSNEDKQEYAKTIFITLSPECAHVFGTNTFAAVWIKLPYLSASDEFMKKVSEAPVHINFMPQTLADIRFIGSEVTVSIDPNMGFVPFNLSDGKYTGSVNCIQKAINTIDYARIFGAPNKSTITANLPLFRAYCRRMKLFSQYMAIESTEDGDIVLRSRDSDSGFTSQIMRPDSINGKISVTVSAEYFAEILDACIMSNAHDAGISFGDKKQNIMFLSESQQFAAMLAPVNVQ